MHYSIYELSRFGVSKYIVDKIINNNISLIDIKFISKKALEQDKHLLKKIKEISVKINNNGFRIEKGILRSIYVLQGYGIDISILDTLYDNDIKDIKDFFDIKIDDFFNLASSCSKGLYFKIIDASKLHIKKMNEDLFVFEILSLDIISYLEDHDFYKIEDLYEKYICNYNYSSLINSVLENLKDNFIINIKNNEIMKYEYSINDILSFNINQIEILKKRIDGESLESIGKQKELSRERIRQIVKQMYDLFPYVKEDYYVGLFEQYKINERDFNLLFDENDETYRYLSSRYRQGKKDLLSCIEEGTVAEEIMERYNLSKKIEGTSDKFLKLSRIDLFNKVVQVYKGNFFTNKSILKIYNDYCIQKGYVNLKSKDLRGIIERSKSIIKSIKNRFRYYDYSIIDEYVISELNEIFIKKDGIYGVGKIYEENKKMMEKLKLKDGHELADLCNRIGLEKFERLEKIHRQSEMQIGKSQKDRFILKCIQEHDGKKVQLFLDYMYSEYGLNINSMKALLTTDYLSYLHEDKIISKIEIPKGNQFYSLMNEKLVNEIYSIDQMKTIINEVFSEDEILISNRLVDKLSYKIRNNYAIRKEYNSVREAFISEILKKEIFDITSNDIFVGQTFTSSINKLLNEHKIFRVSMNKYIKLSKFESLGFTKNDFKNFVESIKFFTKNKNYFSYKSIKYEGFVDKLDELGMEDIFYEELIRTIPQIKYIKTKTPIFYYRGKSNQIRFLEYIIKEVESIDVDDLNYYLKEIYGLELDTYMLENTTYKGEIYYSQILNKFYVNKEKYYEEVYGNGRN